MKKFLYWAPRILSIVLAGFTSVFALDVFDQGYAVGELIVALLMHLLPTIILVLFIVIAWKMENLGGWLFVALGVAYVFIGGFELTAVLLITLPLLVVGAMFLAHYYKYVKGTKDSATPGVSQTK